jgi:ParB family chromosome partitioning protein
VTDKRRGLGRGLGALIPNGTAPVTKPAGDRPVDVFFPGRGDGTEPEAGAVGTATLVEERSDSLEELERSLATVAPRSTPDQDGAGPGPAGSTGDLVPVPGLRFAELPVGLVGPNPRQPRQVFDEEALAELVHSVREIGVLQPVVVRPAGTDDAGQPRYELVMGERRWRAVQEAGLATIPAIVRETADDDLLRDALLENLHRAELNPLEEAAAYQQLLDDFGCTHEELAGRIGRSRPQISNTLRLLKLPPAVQRRVAAGILSAGHARALLGLEDTDSMERLAGRIVSEGLSVRAVEEIVALGDGPAKPARRKPRPGAHTSELDDLASRLGDRLDTRVSVALGRSKGRLSIDFASVEDLNRIIALMAPEVRRAFSES